MLSYVGIHFLHPLVLFLIIIVVFICVFLYKKWNATNLFVWLTDLEKVFWWNSKYFKYYHILIFFILLVYVIVFAWPTYEYTKENINKDWIDIIIALDVSNSMLAEDLSPNRLEVAKWVINDFLEEQIVNRIWIIVFAWRPFNSLPLSFDYNIIKKIVWKIDTDVIDQKYQHLQWTAIWDALVLWAKWFDEITEEKINREKVIILLTDWEANKWIDPMLSLKYLKDNEIKVYTIWIWWLEKTYINIPVFWWRIQKVEVWWVDEETLKTIAEETSWKYFRASSETALKEIFLEINSLEKREIIIEEISNNIEQNNIFVYILLLFMFLLMSLKFYKKIK